MKDLVYDTPKTLIEESFGDFTFNLNEIGELRISNKYDPTTFVLYGEVLGVLRRIMDTKVSVSIEDQVNS